MPTNTVTTHEQRHDERYLELLLEEAKTATKVGYEFNTLKDATRPAGVRFGSGDTRSRKEVLATVDALIEAGDAAIRMYSTTPSALLERYNVALSTNSEAHGRIAEHEYFYGGWQRYFLVVSSSGLVHRDMNCSTCNKGRNATQFALLPSLSGRGIDALVAVLGNALCSVCWPQAPVEMTDADRIPVKLAEILFNQGEEAFTVALAAHRAKEAAKATGKHRVKLSADRKSCAHCAKPIKAITNRYRGTTSYLHEGER